MFNRELKPKAKSQKTYARSKGFGKASLYSFITGLTLSFVGVAIFIVGLGYVLVNNSESQRKFIESEEYKNYVLEEISQAENLEEIDYLKSTDHARELMTKIGDKETAEKYIKETKIGNGLLGGGFAGLGGGIALMFGALALINKSKKDKELAHQQAIEEYDWFLF